MASLMRTCILNTPYGIVIRLEKQIITILGLVDHSPKMEDEEDLLGISLIVEKGVTFNQVKGF